MWNTHFESQKEWTAMIGTIGTVTRHPALLRPHKLRQKTNYHGELMMFVCIVNVHREKKGRTGDIGKKNQREMSSIHHQRPIRRNDIIIVNKMVSKEKSVGMVVVDDGLIISGKLLSSLIRSVSVTPFLLFISSLNQWALFSFFFTTISYPTLPCSFLFLSS